MRVEQRAACPGAQAMLPLQIKRLPWVDRSDEEDSPLAPMNGDESLLSSQSLEADLLFVGADDVPLGVDVEELAVGWWAESDAFTRGSPPEELARNRTAVLTPFLARGGALFPGISRLKRLELQPYHSDSKLLLGWDEYKWKTENGPEVEDAIAPLRELVEGPVIFRTSDGRVGC